MPAPFAPVRKGDNFVFRVALKDAANPGSFKSNPTIAAGDFKVDKDGGGLTALTVLPTVSPASSVLVKVNLTQDEMNSDVVTLHCVDQTSPKEWEDRVVSLTTLTTVQIPYTYTHTLSPHASQPDGSFNKLNDGLISGGAGIVAVTYTGSWEYYLGTGDWAALTTMDLPSFTANTQVGWQNGDANVVCDLGSAITPHEIWIYGIQHGAANIKVADGFRIRAADDSGITTNVITPFADVTGLSDPNQNNRLWFATLNVSAAAARRYWEIRVHWQVEWLWISEIQFRSTV